VSNGRTDEAGRRIDEADGRTDEADGRTDEAGSGADKAGRRTDFAESSEQTIGRAANALLRWLLDVAYPLWANHGVDNIDGGFHETLDHDARPAYEPRRIRVQARQTYCFARAAALGWTGDSGRLIDTGLSYVRSHYRRPDGLFRTLVAPDGTPLDDRAFLYDQAFVLLAFAESHRALGQQSDVVADAVSLREALYTHLKRSGGGGFGSEVTDPVPILANPHMHLLEAALAWLEVSDDPAWQVLADEIADLALQRFSDPRTGALREQFGSDWTPLGPEMGAVVEPGHQFEWAWLLSRWCGCIPGAALSKAERLVEIGEAYGVHRGVALMGLQENFSVMDGSARLWGQTERLKASLILAQGGSQPRYWVAAASALASIWRFLEVRTPGLWHDRLAAGGQFVPTRVPASSFYHIVSAVTELVAREPRLS
jgi:mannose/cellobiose epimerase-like protein (N-acyl-D-glucosamine 2-epimerase family)